MKKYWIIILLAVIIASCNSGNNHDHGHDHDHSGDHDHDHATEHAAGNLGECVDPAGAVDADRLVVLMENNDQMDIKLVGTIDACCQHSGCWMDLDLGDQVMNVTFKDGDFTIPKDAAGKEAIIEGVATKELIPVDRLKAYAMDEGLPQEEIDAIIEPAYQYTFVASGVLLK